MTGVKWSLSEVTGAKWALSEVGFERSVLDAKWAVGSEWSVLVRSWRWAKWPLQSGRHEVGVERSVFHPTFYTYAFWLWGLIYPSINLSKLIVMEIYNSFQYQQIGPTLAL